MNENISKPSIFVGLGASAGGIEACMALLRTVPAESGAAFIVILHLDPTRSSRIADILQSASTTLTVTEAMGTERLQADHVYVIAPNSKLSFADGNLEVEGLTENETRGGLVDYLFSSLAAAEGPRAVGVVLSGAGHDGTRGMTSIRKAGGMCLAQTPAEAGTPHMPQSAIDAEVVDAVLPLAEIWPALEAFATKGSRPADSLQSAKRSRGGHAAVRSSDDKVQGGGFRRVLQLLGDEAGINFDDYKTGTLERRARRRMALLPVSGWDEYADRLDDDADERKALYHDVLIGVTAFFRDNEVWTYLAEKLKALAGDGDEMGFRAWIAGCATGEEAYSLAMLACDQMHIREARKIQIYATDVNVAALAFARHGVYSVEALESVDKVRRERHFTNRNGKLQIVQSTRDCITFAPHNVLHDAPFSKMDVVTCRNLLIYLKPHAHDRLLRHLHFALKPGGLLVLGRAERLGKQHGLFDEISKRHSIFRARPLSQERRFQIASRIPKRPPIDAPTRATNYQSPSSPAVRSDRRVEQYLLRRHTTACAVINSCCEIQQLYGCTDRYLIPPTGEPRQDLLAWIRPGFYVRLRSALRKAIDSAEPVDTEGQLERDDQMWGVQCSISPFPASVGVNDLFLVTFRDTGNNPRVRREKTDSGEPMVRELEQELHDTQLELQSTVAQLESVGEEFRAGHEELLSLNEELQASNEELEASKEELEALNEEMNTINRELELKNAELREANSDLDNLFVSTGIPTIFLDRNLKIRRYTSAATELMRLVHSDKGRSIEDIKERFGNGSTAEKCRAVLETLQPNTSEVRTTNGRVFTRCIVPYRTDDGDVDGICLTFIEITEQYRAIERSKAERAYSEAVIRATRTPILVLDQGLRLLSMNDAFKTLFGATESAIGEPLSEIRDQKWNIVKLDEVLMGVIRTGDAVNDYEVTSNDRSILINVRRVQGAEDTARVVLSFEDITHQRKALEHAKQRSKDLRDAAARKDQWIAMLGHELRNPVGAVTSGINLLLQSESLPADQQRRVVEMMDRHVGHVSKLLDELLDASRIVAGKLVVRFAPVDLGEVCRLAIESVRPSIEENEHRLVVDLPPPNTVWVSGDHVRLTQVFGNLLINATKYTNPGGQLDFIVHAKEQTVVIEVRDTGIGVPDSQKERIFEIFTQGPLPAGRQTRGLGLGLPLVYNLVKAHQGNVEVVSDGDAAGSVFRVTLPRLRYERESSTSDMDGTRPQTQSQRILIVDDLADAGNALAALLENDGHQALAVDDAISALEIIGEFRPHIAMLDIGMPGMDGYELARRIRNSLPDVTLVAVTGFQRNPARLAEAGFVGHLIKPVSLATLRDLMSTGPST